ncbi:MAG: uroporphyrinogen decarboxylase family protein [Methanomassiliicoccales archaeon]
MSPKERFLNALSLQKVDRVPIMYQHLGGSFHLQNITGITIAEGLRSASKHKRLCMSALTEFGFDNVMVGWGDLLAEAESLGAKVVYGDQRSYPMGKEINSDEIEMLEPVDPKDGSIWSVQLQAAKELQEEIGDDVLVVAAMNDPFLVASMIRGLENLLMDQIVEPEKAHKILGVVLTTLKEGARIMREECGIDVIFLGDGVADSSQNDLVNSITFDISYSSELIRYMKRLGLKVILSNCTLNGYVEEQINRCSPDAMHIASEGKAYARAIDLIRGKRGLVAGISPTRKILVMAPDEIEMEARKIVQNFGDSPGLILASAGEITPETPPENILALAHSIR